MTSADRYNLDDARRFLSLLARPGDVFELRGLAKVHGQPHVTAGYFDDLEQLARAAADRSGKDDGVYVTLNPVVNALLARLPKNKVHRVGNGQTTSDRDVRQRRSLLIDIDPVRPAGISSSNEEHKGAITLARRVRDELIREGWPLPIFADSGNGAHLIYAVELPVDDGGLVKRVLARLSKRFTTPELKVDEKVFNAARISKIYGTLTRKGEDTAERPHRLARIIEAPPELAVLTRETIEAFLPADTKASPTKPRADRFTTERAEFDLTAWLAERLPDAKERTWSEGRKWILPVCPFNDQHDRGEAYVCQMHSGAVAAGCLHDSCKWSWTDLRGKLEPEYAERRARAEHHNGNGNGANGHRITDREPPHEVLFEDDRYANEIARTEAEYDRIADQDRDVKPATDTKPEKTPWKRAPQLVAAIMARVKDPWISLKIGDDELARARAGATIVVIGGSGSGKSSLTLGMMVDHARDVGPAIVLSIELPEEEAAARIVGQKCDASWEEALRGLVPIHEMERVLNLPRLYMLDRRRATISNLEKCVDAARAEYPGEPILVAIDYAQLLDSKEREARMRVADAFAQIDDCAREKRFVAVALSQMSRASAQRARQGEAIGAESADLGAETAAIERFATFTMSIGLAVDREDGSSAVELSIGKARMSKGDKVVPMTYWGRSGLWRVAGEAKKADEVREQREVDKNEKLDKTLEAALVGIATKSPQALTKTDLKKQISGNSGRKTSAIERLLARKPPELVQVMRRAKGAKKNDWMVWTPDRARDAGEQIVEFNQTEIRLGGSSE